MKPAVPGFSRPNADVFVPDGTNPAEALARTTHLCVAAHQDDIEIMAYTAIVGALVDRAFHFTGVVVTDGAGSPRTGDFATVTDNSMREVRREEQRRAAALGRYNLQIQLAHPSAAVKRPGDPGVAADLDAIFSAARPGVVYLHNPADSHDTHVALAARCIEALRRLPPDRRPGRVLGCEVWRGLDWLVGDDKVMLDTSPQPELARSLLQVFESQVRGGKRYDEATEGRRRANATFVNARAADQARGLAFAMDLTPLVEAETADIVGYTLAHVDRLRADVEKRIRQHI